MRRGKNGDGDPKNDILSREAEKDIEVRSPVDGGRLSRK